MNNHATEFAASVRDAASAIQAVETLGTEINLGMAALVEVREKMARRRHYIEGCDDVQNPPALADGTRPKANEQTRAAAVIALLDIDDEYPAWREEERTLDAKVRAAQVEIETWREMRSIAKRRLEFTIAMATLAASAS